MFRLSLAIVLAVFAGIQGKKAQKSAAQAFSEMKRHSSFPLFVALLVLILLLIVAGFVLSAVADVWEHASELGGVWFAVATLVGILSISIAAYLIVRRINRPTRRRLSQNDETLFVTQDLAKPLPRPDDADLRLKRIRTAMQAALKNRETNFLKDGDVEFLRADDNRRSLIEDEIKKNIRNLVDAASSEQDRAGAKAHELAEHLIKINPAQVDWCRAELSTLKQEQD